MAKILQTLKGQAMKETINALAARISTAPAYTAGDLGADIFNGGEDAVILVNVEHRDLIAAALRAFVEK